MIPRKELNTESKINAWRGASGSPFGAGIFSTMASRSGALAAEKFADLVGHDFRTGSVHVNLIQDRDNLQSMFDSLVKIGNGLSLNAL